MRPPGSIQPLTTLVGGQRDGVAVVTRVVGDRIAAAGTAPVPMRPRGGFGTYLNELRRLRGMTIRGLATVAGLHHTYISKLERGDRSAPDAQVVEAIAVALATTPSQLDQLRWRAGTSTAPSPTEDGVVGDPPDGQVSRSDRPRQIDLLGDPAMTLLADALAQAPEIERAVLRQAVATAVGSVQALPAHHPGRTGSVATVQWPSVRTKPTQKSVLPLPIDPASITATVAPAVDRFGGGIVTLEAGAAEIHVAPEYLWQLIQHGQLSAWVLPGTPVGSMVGVRVRREDLLGLLRPLAFAPPRPRQ